MIGISGSLIWSKTLMELIIPVVNFGEVRRTHLAKSTLLTSTLVPRGIVSDLLKFVQMLKREWGAESNGKLPHLFYHILQPWFLSLRWKTCLRQNCSLSSCACSEGPALAQKILTMNTNFYIFESLAKMFLVYIYIYIAT